MMKIDGNEPNSTHGQFFYNRIEASVMALIHRE
jgi:hypothetical protein